MNLRPDQYQRFGEWLRTCELERITLPFSQIEAIIGAPLPPSALRHRVWWSNSPTHPLARAWLLAGWKAPREGLDLEAQTITLVQVRQSG